MQHPSLIDAAMFAEFRDLLPPETVQQQLHTLLDTRHSAIEAMGALLVQHREQGARVAHQLKGACMLIGFVKMADILARIEHTAVHTQDAIPAHLLEQLRRAANDTRQDVAGHMPSGTGNLA